MKESIENYFVLSIIYLNLHANNHKEFNDKLKELIISYSTKNNNEWNDFKLIRLMVRFGFYECAKQILENLYSKIKTSIDLNHVFYIEFLLNVCDAEHLLNIKITNFNDVIKNLNNALSLYVKAQIILKSINSSILQTQLNSYFQLKYCELRCEQIKIFIHFF